jgi:hypothetical protein
MLKQLQPHPILAQVSCPVPVRYFLLKADIYSIAQWLRDRSGSPQRIEGYKRIAHTIADACTQMIARKQIILFINTSTPLYPFP